MFLIASMFALCSSTVGGVGVSPALTCSLSGGVYTSPNIAILAFCFPNSVAVVMSAAVKVLPSDEAFAFIAFISESTYLLKILPTSSIALVTSNGIRSLYSARVSFPIRRLTPLGISPYFFRYSFLAAVIISIGSRTGTSIFIFCFDSNSAFFAFSNASYSVRSLPNPATPPSIFIRS